MGVDAPLRIDTSLGRNQPISPFDRAAIQANVITSAGTTPMVDGGIYRVGYASGEAGTLNINMRRKLTRYKENCATPSFNGTSTVARPLILELGRPVSEACKIITPTV